MNVLSPIRQGGEAERLQPLGLEPGRVWSLWDMVTRYKVGELVDLHSFFCACAHAYAVPGQTYLLTPDQHEMVSGKASRYADLLKEFGLPVAASIAKEIVTGLNISVHASGNYIFQGQIKDSLAANYMNMANLLGREMQTQIFVSIKAIYSDFYEPHEPLFGTKVAQKFPSLSYEIDEAGKCIAFERSTASVFHAIRCLEAALRAMSRCLGINDPTKGSQRSWAAVSGALKTAIDAKYPPNMRLGGDAALFDEVLAILAAMQNPYRNSTMHLDKIYTMDDALHIFGSVKVLLQKLASRMDENGEPKA